jgi:nucleotide-binding universal stress UspA family protein
MPFELNTLLLPVDLTPVSKGVFTRALSLVRGEDAALILLHVIDPHLVDFAAGLKLDDREKIVEKLRSQAEAALAELKSTELEGTGNVEIQVIISEGTPFVEILRKAEDFEVDAIVMGRYGSHGPIEKMLFGSTAEHVIRGSLRAVIVVPVEI